MKTQLKKNEKVVLTIRKHWFVLLKPMLWTVILIIIALAGSNSEFGNFFLIGAGLTIAWFIYWILDRNTNLWAVTNLRVIDEYGVFSNNSKETPLEKINNVSYRQPLLGRIFNYGHVQIQSAAESGSTLHKMVENPKKLKDTITQYQEIYKQEQIKEQAQIIFNIINQVDDADSITKQENDRKYKLKNKFSWMHSGGEKILNQLNEDS